MFNFTVELKHDLMIHLSYFIFQLGDFLLDWYYLGLELLELKFVDIFNLFHFSGFLQMSDNLGLFELNRLLLIFQLFHER